MKEVEFDTHFKNSDDPFLSLREVILRLKDKLKELTYKERDFVTEMSKYLDCD